MRLEREPLRTCEVDGKNYLFHCWEHYSEIIEPSPMKGGHSGGIIGCTFGIVENEQGNIKRVPCYNIKFTDREYENYCFKNKDLARQ